MNLEAPYVLPTKARKSRFGYLRIVQVDYRMLVDAISAGPLPIDLAKVRLASEPLCAIATTREVTSSEACYEHAGLRWLS
jgi:hypothetical protein